MHIQRCCSVLVLGLSLLAGARTLPEPEPPKAPAAGPALPVTTASAQARRLFEQGMADSLNFHTDRALESWRAAVKLDPSFALAHVFIGFRTPDPAEERTALAQAKTAAVKATPGERLLIRWISGIRQGDFIGGIAAMNDVIAMYPRDKQLLSLAGNWLMIRQNFEHAEELLERAVAVDPDYAPALNSLAYAHAQQGKFADAVKNMEHYAELIPSEPNPQDSYAEILRMAGQFDAAVEHYQAALKMAPAFSLMGLGDTYALKGDQELARGLYQQCIAGAEVSADRILCRLQFAATYVRQQDYAAADAAFTKTAQWAHGRGLALTEAQAHRMMAMYQKQAAEALKHLDRAAAVLAEHPNVSASDSKEEMSRILRWRVVIAGRAGRSAEAEKSLQRLQAMAKRDRSDVIWTSYHAAAGWQLLSAGQTADAIPHLLECSGDPFSMQSLARAYSQSGANDDAARWRKKLSEWNMPTLDQALASNSATLK